MCYVYKGSNRVSDIKATPTDIVWSAPSDVPMGCFPHYIVSLADDPTTTLTVNSTMASSEDLAAAGFSFCVRHSIIVIPIGLFTGAPLITKRAIKPVAITDPGT